MVTATETQQKTSKPISPTSTGGVFIYLSPQKTMPKPAKFQAGRRKSNAKYNEELDQINKKQLKKPLSQQVQKTLKEKAATSKYSYSDLVKVYKRGQGSYLSSGKKNISMTQWAMARVNKFLKGHGISDKDIYSKNKKLDINEQVKKLFRRIKNANEKGIVQKSFDEIHKIIYKQNDNLKQDYITELHEIEKKYGTQLKNQIYKKPVEEYIKKYSMILPPEVREKLEEGTLIFNTSANEIQIVDSNDKTKIVGTIENPNIAAVTDNEKQLTRSINQTGKPNENDRNYKFIKTLNTTEKAFYFKYVSPIGYYSWHEIASKYIQNYKNTSKEKRFKIFSSPAYYLTDELVKAFIDTPVDNLKLDEEPKIINNSFFVLQSTSITNVKYVFVDCIYQKGFVYLHISLNKPSNFEGYSIKFSWKDLSNFHQTDGTTNNDELIQNQFRIIVNMILLMNQQPDIELEYMPPSITIPVQRGFSKPEIFKPRPIVWIGKEFSKRVVKIYPKREDILPKQAGFPKRPHWRRGHWHTVLQGPKREQRRMKWYEPVYIKGKKL